MTISGSALTNLTNYSGTDNQPRWSPDGKKIAFVRTGIGIGHNIWVMDADGSNPMSLTNGATTLNDDPVWSPDGKKIAFVRDFGDGSTGGPGKEIYVMNADFGGGQTNLSNSPGDDVWPRWSPTGGKIAFLAHRDPLGTSKQDLFTMNPDGSGVLRLTSGGLNDDFCWSPDATQIALTSGDLVGSMAPPLYLIPAGGGPMTKLTNNGWPNFACEWFPDGSRIAWTVEDKNSDSVWVMNSDGTGQVALAPGLYPTWSHFYDRIAYQSFGQIATIRPDGSNGKILTNTQLPVWNRRPQWKP